MRWIIIDDNQKELLQIKEVISKYLIRHSLICDLTVLDNVTDYDINDNYDCYFLDIDMPKDGITLAKEITKKNKLAKIIFITNRADLVFQSFSVHPYDFIKKEDLQSSINNTLDGIMSDIQSNDKYITIKINNGISNILISSVQYIKSFDHLCYIYTNDKTIKTWQKLTYLENHINNADFFMVHRSYVINWNYVSKIVNKNIYIADIEIPISKYRMKMALESYHDFIARKL